MWPRIVELMLGVWLLIAPFVFAVPLDGTHAIQAWICGSAVIAASCLSYWPPACHARAATAVIGLWLAASAYLRAGHPAAPPIQNELLIGLLLIMFAIIPNEAGEPPTSWRPFVQQARTPGARS